MAFGNVDNLAVLVLLVTIFIDKFIRLNHPPLLENCTTLLPTGTIPMVDEARSTTEKTGQIIAKKLKKVWHYW